MSDTDNASAACTTAGAVRYVARVDAGECRYGSTPLRPKPVHPGWLDAPSLFDTAPPRQYRCQMIDPDMPADIALAWTWIFRAAWAAVFFAAGFCVGAEAALRILRGWW